MINHLSASQERNIFDVVCASAAFAFDVLAMVVGLSLKMLRYAGLCEFVSHYIAMCCGCPTNKGGYAKFSDALSD
jgi:hypothetical protein